MVSSSSTQNKKKFISTKTKDILVAIILSLGKRMESKILNPLGIKIVSILDGLNKYPKM